MKIDLCDLLNPNNSPPVGTLARVLSLFLRNVDRDEYLERGTWGRNGPREILTDHESCVNCTGPWCSDRRGLHTYRDIQRGIQRTLTAAMLDQRLHLRRWRRENHIEWDKAIVIGGRKECYPEKLFNSFLSLHGREVPYSANSFHTKARTLCHPRLVVSELSICLRINVTLKTELRLHKRSASQWDVGSQLRYQPKWHPGRENFGQYIERATNFFLTGRQS